MAMLKAKVCRIYVGLLLEDSIGLWFGMDVKRKMFNAIGSADIPVSLAAFRDVGHVVAQLARMPYEDIPPKLRISGDASTMKQVAEVMENAGSPSLTVRTTDLEGYKNAAIGENTADPMKYLRFLTGKGKIDYSASGDELVNPKQEIWRWKTVKQYAEEVKGQPWVDAEWPRDSSLDEDSQTHSLTSAAFHHQWSGVETDYDLSQNLVFWNSIDGVVTGFPWGISSNYSHAYIKFCVNNNSNLRKLGNAFCLVHCPIPHIHVLRRTNAQCRVSSI